MSIGTNIYTLRKAKKITQAQLAQKLGVSEQAVSKWENEQCAPDVSLFPIIADYFGVSIDRIFGYHMNSYTEEVKAIIKAANDSGDTFKEIEICREGLNRFPNSSDLKISLAFSLSMINRISQDERERQEAINEAIRLCEEVVDICGDILKIDEALNLLARIYGEIGEHKNAMAAIEKISGENYFFRVTGIARTLGYEHSDKEMISFIEKNLFDCWLAMNQNLAVMTSRLSELGKHNEVVSFCKARLKLLSVFDDGCADFYASHKFFANHLLAHTYRKLGDRKQCLETLYALMSCVSQIKAVEQNTDFHISARNPMYFSAISDSVKYEECLRGFSIENLLSPFDDYFEDDEEYQQFRKAITTTP